MTRDPAAIADSETPPRRWVRTLKRFAFGLFLVAGGLSLTFWGAKRHYARTGAQELAAVTSKLDAEEPDWRLDALMKRYAATVPPSPHNSAVVVLDAYDALPEQWGQWRRVDVSRVPALHPSANHLPQAKRAEALAALREPTAAARTIARTLKDMPNGGYTCELQAEPFRTPWPHTEKFLTVLRLLGHDAHLSLLDGNPDGALMSAVAELNAARSIGRMPVLIAQIARSAGAAMSVSTVGEILAVSEPTAGLDALQEAFTHEAGVPRMGFGFQGELAGVDALFTAFEEGKELSPDAEGAFRTGLPWRRGGSLSAYRGMSQGDHAECLRVLSEAIAALKLPAHEQLAVLEQIRRPERDFAHPLAVYLAFRDPRGFVANDHGVRAQLLAAAAGIACERFRRKHGRWPASLEEIPPDILPEVPVSPFDNRPAVLVPEADGVTVYIAGVGAARTPFRLWNPDRRRLPATETPKGKS